MHKIIISVAPVAHTGKALPADARNPVLPHDIAEEVIRCSDEGAAIAHLHVRNTSGDIVGDTSVFSETISMPLSQCPYCDMPCEHGNQLHFHAFL